MTTHRQGVDARPYQLLDPGAGGETLPSPTGTPDPTAWRDWTYTTTLLATAQPVYHPRQVERGEERETIYREEQARLTAVESAMKVSVAKGLAVARRLVEEAEALDDHGWEKVADFAKTNGDLELAIRIRARHQPVGLCSMDIGPQLAAQSYAELCFQAGRLGCFLNLQVQIMGDQFERVAYSNYGEAAHETQAERLRDIGIDVERFLRGLLYQFHVPEKMRREIDPWRLARSIREAQLGGKMVSDLRADAARPHLDGFNRLRAAQTLAYLRYQGAVPAGFERDAKVRAKAIAEVRAELRALRLPPAAAAWAASFGQD